MTVVEECERERDRKEEVVGLGGEWYRKEGIEEKGTNGGRKCWNSAQFTLFITKTFICFSTNKKMTKRKEKLQMR